MENQILNEIKGIQPNLPVFEQVKNMVYTHASLCESLRLYPPVPMDTRVAEEDDNYARWDKGEERDGSDLSSICNGEDEGDRLGRV